MSVWRNPVSGMLRLNEDFKGTQYSFCAMIFETLGAVNVEGEEVLRRRFLVVNLLPIVVGHGLDCRAIYSDLLLNLFLIVLMAANSLTM